MNDKVVDHGVVKDYVPMTWPELVALYSDDAEGTAHGLASVMREASVIAQSFARMFEPGRATYRRLIIWDRPRRSAHRRRKHGRAS